MADFSFARPELLALALLAPLAAIAATWFWRRRLAAAEDWSAKALWNRLFAGYRRGRIGLSIAGLALAVLGIGLALAQPRWGNRLEEVEREGVDLIFILDGSLSMGAQDTPPSRMFVAKEAIRRLVRELPGNRVGLVGVGASGTVLTPLTSDVAMIDLILGGVEPGSLPTQGTRLASSLGVAIDLFPPGTDKHRAIVLISDGEDHGGGLSDRIEALNAAGIVVHTLGVGTLQGGTIPDPSRPGGLKRDREGQIVNSRLREENLELLARGTDGVYLRATDAAVDLTPIFDRIGAMETRSLGSQTLAQHAERFQWPLGLGVLALLAYLAIPAFAAESTNPNRDLVAARSPVKSSGTVR